MPVTVAEKLYICPGEHRPISRAVHLSRLAAFYPACRDCPLRCDTGQLPQRTLERLRTTEGRVERATLFTGEGVRGVYLNELTRAKAGAIAAAFAALLWDAAPLAAGTGDSAAGDDVERRVRPSVVVGYDERPSSPDLFAGVAAALRLMGCQVIDLGLTTRPCFWFAADHLQASAGVFVTGSGCGMSWNGLDLVGPRGRPVSRETVAQPLTLKGVEARLRQPCSRPSRQAGVQRTFHARVPYQAGLWKHFHALRPLKVICGCPIPLVWKTLEQIFKTLPCRLIRAEIPRRVRNPVDPADEDVRRVGRAVRRHAADVGLLIDDDGQRCGVLDERGALVAPAALIRLLAKCLLAESPRVVVVAESADFESLRPEIERLGGRCVSGGETMADLAGAMQTHNAHLGGGSSGRVWVNEAFPTSDAVLTLARVLAALSRSDAPLSAIV